MGKDTGPGESEARSDFEMGKQVEGKEGQTQGWTETLGARQKRSEATSLHFVPTHFRISRTQGGLGRLLREGGEDQDPGRRQGPGKEEDSKPDQTVGQAQNQVNPLLLPPPIGASWKCLPTSHLTGTYFKFGLLSTLGSLRTEPGYCHLDLTQPELVFSAPYHVPKAMGACSDTLGHGLTPSSCTETLNDLGLGWESCIP